MNKKSFTKKALILSISLLVLWAMMGTSTTIAWFTDTTPTAKNSFVIGELDLQVSYKNDIVTKYTPVDSETSVFNDEALYEPGYTQVVYLKIENAGDIDFNYKLSVDRYDYVDSTNVFGGTLHLPKYLRFCVIFSATEPEMQRKTAQALQDMTDMDILDQLPLNQYSKLDDVTVAVGQERYAALIVYMPEDVGNEANYLKDYPVPTVELGLTVYAQQAGTPMA